MQSFWKTEKRSCGFVFFACFLLQSTYAQNSRPDLESPVGSGVSTEVISGALEFLNSEGRTQDFESLQKKIVPLGDPALIEKIIEIHMSNRKRESLLLFMSNLSRQFRCRAQFKRAPICDWLGKLWKNNLDSVYFFEESPGKILRAANLVSSRECALAQKLLKEVESKEGFPKPLVDTARVIAECLGNKDLISVYEQRATELRVFE